MEDLFYSLNAQIKKLDSLLSVRKGTTDIVDEIGIVVFLYIIIYEHIYFIW